MSLPPPRPRLPGMGGPGMDGAPQQGGAHLGASGTTGGRRFIGIAVAVVGLVVVAAIVVATALHLASGGAGPSAESGSQWSTQTSFPEASSDAGAEQDEGDDAASSHGPSASTTHSPTGTSGEGECRARDLELSIEGGGSKSRTLVVTNTGRSACTIEGVPELRFLSDRGSELDVAVDGAGSSRPFTLEPGESAEAKLTWSGSSHGSTARSIEATLAPGVTLEVRASLPISSGMDVEVKAWS